MKNEIFNLIERMANLLRQESRYAGQKLGLQPIQQEALYYLACCNRYSDTTLAVAEYLGLTKGTVSQTLKVLESKALIERIKDPFDKRVVHLKLTERAQEFVQQTSPPEKFGYVIDELPKSEQKQLTDLLKASLNKYHDVTGRVAFGVCKHCQFNIDTESGSFCNLTKEPLTDDDVKLICREFINK